MSHQVLLRGSPLWTKVIGAATGFVTVWPVNSWLNADVFGILQGKDAQITIASPANGNGNSSSRPGVQTVR